MHSGDDYFTRLEELINGAKHEIHLQTYVFDSDETGTRIANALIKAAQRGVSIFMVLDAYGTDKLTKEMKQQLKAVGIKLRFFGAIGSAGSLAWGRRLHHKIIVADRCRALVGGINISNRYANFDEKEWFDFALMIDGSAVQQIVKVCQQVYSQWFVQPQQGYTQFEHFGGENKGIKIQLQQNDWLRSKNQIAQAYAKAIKAAKHEIIIANSYFLPGSFFRNLLKDAAKRGVKVKILLPGVSDVLLAKQAINYLYRFLLRNNMEIYEWMPSVLHAKIACIDGQWCTVGSYNLNYLSAYASIEFNVSVLDEEFSTHFAQYLHTQLLSDCVKVKKADFLGKQSLLKLFSYWFSFRLLKLSEALLISFPGQHFFKANEYA